jgi:hypothetical protein
MMACCTNTYDLGCFDSCDTILLNEETVGTDIVYEQNGLLKILFETQFRFKINQDATQGEIIELDLQKFPENADITLRLYNADGSRFIHTIGSAMYDCFSIRIDIYRTNNYEAMGTLPTCCAPKIFSYTGVDTATLTYDDWSKFGKIPTLEAYYNDGSSYISIPIQPMFNSMPNPTQITVTIGGIPTDTWYIKLS